MLGGASISVIKGNILGVYYEPGASAAILGHVTDTVPPSDPSMSAVIVSDTLRSDTVSVGIKIENLLVQAFTALPNLQPLMIRGKITQEYPVDTHGTGFF